MLNGNLEVKLNKILSVKTLITRTISGIVYAAVMIYAFYADDYPFFFIGLAALLQFLCTKELFSISKKLFPEHDFPLSHLIIAILSNLLILIVLMVMEPVLVTILFTLPIILMTQIVLSKKKIIPSTITALISIIYIGIPISLMFSLKFLNPIIPLSVLFMIWINDTMAYLTGSLIGKTPLSPISPKKTIEGTAGGVLFTIVFAVFFGIYYPDNTLSIWAWLILGFIVGIFGNMGDLFESFLKRKAGIKDSGNILPGHGGMLDRLDSLLFVFPIVYVFILLINNY